MTFLGKLFVMVNVAVSLLMAFLAFGLYLTGVEWGYDPAKPGQVGGLLKQKQDQIKEYQAAQPNAEDTWRKARVNLWTTEQARRDDRVFYAKEFDHLKNKASADGPARTVKIDDKTFRPARDPAGLPTMETAKERGDRAKAKDLLSRAHYDGKLATAQKDNRDMLADLKTQIDKDRDLTDYMIDLDVIQKVDKEVKTRKLPPDDLEPRGPRGLRALLVLERSKREGVEEEQRQVRPLYINTAIESELIFKRVESLEARIAELRAYIKKRNLDSELSKR